VTTAQQKIAAAVLFLREYKGDFEFLKDMQKTIASPGATLTERQVEAVLRCAAREKRIAGGGSPSSEEVEPGVYQIDGDVYKVKFNRERTRKYAVKLVYIDSERLNEEDERVPWEFQYAPGAIYKLKPEHRMDEESAKTFGLKYGICASCGKRLKVAESVERGIGPVCIKWFRF